MKEEFWLYLYDCCCFINFPVAPSPLWGQRGGWGKFEFLMVFIHSFQCDKHSLKWKKAFSDAKYFEHF